MAKAKNKAKEDTSTTCANDKLIKPNVGGQSYCTSYGTLKASSYFKNILDNDMENVSYVNDDEVFIDRSGQLFEYVLQYLISYDFRIGEGDCLQELKMEAEHYQLDDMVQNINDMLATPKKKEHSLIDSNDLEAISCIKSEGGSVISISELYEVVSVVSFKGAKWKSGNSNCYNCSHKYNNNYILDDNDELTKKLLIAKK